MHEPILAASPAEAPILIIGDGAIGVALGSRLHASGLHPRFIGRHGPIAVQGRISGPGGLYVLDVPAPSAAAAPCLAIVAVKAFDLAAALTATRDLPAGVPVWLLGNGAIYPQLAAARQQRPDLRWRLGYCTYGVSVVGPRELVWRSTTGEFAIGPLRSEETPTAAEALVLNKASPTCKWHPQILWMHRRKWLFNTVINTLAASRRLAVNADLLADLPMLAAVFNEAWLLGADLWGSWPMPRDEVYQGVLRLIAATADNENSMARDRRLGRRTESDFLAGLATDALRFPLLTQLHRQLA